MVSFVRHLGRLVVVGRGKRIVIAQARRCVTFTQAFAFLHALYVGFLLLFYATRKERWGSKDATLLAFCMFCYLFTIASRGKLFFFLADEG